jgi:hypothetical protein
MRLKIASLSILALATALPAAAEHGRDRYHDRGNGPDYRYEECRNDAKNKQAVGAVIGGLIGGVAGNKIASRQSRDEGAVLGAVVGAIAGSQIAKSKADCDRRDDRYNYVTDRDYDDRYYRDRAYTDEYYRGDEYRGETYGRNADWGGELAGGPDGPYNPGYRDERFCTTAISVTRLPDGREIRRPVETCRSGGYGDWDDRN